MPVSRASRKCCPGRRARAGSAAARRPTCPFKARPRPPRCGAAASEIGADVFVQPMAARDKKLLVADMDSTLIGSGMHRRTRQGRRRRRAGRGDHRAGDARRTRFRRRPARARRAARRARPARDRPSARRGASRSIPARKPSRRRFARAAGISPSSPAASSRSPGRWRPGSAPTSIAPTGWRREGGRLTGRVEEPIQGADAKLGALARIAGAAERCRPQP